jgi:hypothetical protein
MRVGFFDYKLLIYAATDNSFLLYYTFIQSLSTAMLAIR